MTDTVPQTVLFPDLFDKPCDAASASNSATVSRRFRRRRRQILDTLARVFQVRRSRAPPSRSGLLTINMNDSPARIDAGEAAVGRRTQTARRLVEASVSPNTRRAYAGALRRLDVLARRPRARRRDPRGVPRRSCTTPGALPRAPRWRSPRRAFARSSPVSQPRPASEPPGCSPATGGPPAIGAGASRGPSGPRTWRPCSPPAIARDGAGGASDGSAGRRS